VTSPVSALLGKEIDQFRSVFLWLVAFSFFTSWMFKNLMSYSGSVVSYLTLTSVFATAVLVIIAFLIGQKLIIQEYYGQTQRFVEALPIKRGYMSVVKFVVGFASLLVLAVGVWLYSILLARSHEPVSGQFAWFMFLRLTVYVFCSMEPGVYIFIVGSPSNPIDCSVCTGNIDS
jgi:hypothetical protein